MKILDMFKKNKIKYSSFDLSVQEQTKIIHKAAKESNKDQLNLINKYNKELLKCVD